MVSYLNFYYINCAIHGFNSFDVKSGERLHGNQILDKVLSELDTLQKPLNKDDLISFVINEKEALGSKLANEENLLKEEKMKKILDKLMKAGYKNNVKTKMNLLKKINFSVFFNKGLIVNGNTR